jgi:cardiolipin synthase
VPALRTRRVPRKWRHRLEPLETKRRRPRGIPGLWTRLRRLLWSWGLWAAAAVVASMVDRDTTALVCAIVAMVAYLIAPYEQPPTYGLDHETTVASPAFLPSITGLTGMPMIGGNRVRVLNNGDEFYPAMLAAIRGASASITIEAYIYWKGDIGLEFAQALAERGRAGVSVKILLDAVGSSTIGAEILKILEDGRCELAWFNPIRPFSIGRFNYRTHRKSLIVDGRLAFTGGAGIADHWCGSAHDSQHWRDMQIEIEGPGMVPLQTGFAQNWLQTTSELVSGPRFFPVVSPAGEVALHGVLSSPSSGASSARVLYYFSIVCARRSIWITNPYFVPDQAGIDALLDAKRRGVDVRITVAGRLNDNWLARQNSVRLFGQLLAAGIAVFEYQQRMIHQKTMIVDGRWATIGTTNFDNRSFAFNEENNISFTDLGVVAELEAAYRADEAASERVTLEKWRRRGVVQRARELVASFLQDQV